MYDEIERMKQLREVISKFERIRVFDDLIEKRIEYEKLHPSNTPEQKKDSHLPDDLFNV